MRPGIYLQKRRIAAGLSRADVAEQLARLPWAVRRATPEEIDRREARLAAVEDGRDLFVREKAELLRAVYPFDVGIYLRLVEIDAAPGCGHPTPQLCRDCACSYQDPCVDECGPCGWAEHPGPAQAGLCTRCLRIQSVEAELVPAPLRHLRAVAPGTTRVGRVSCLYDWEREKGRHLQRQRVCLAVSIACLAAAAAIFLVTLWRAINGS